jgi:excisionase family DNA binding protein
MTNEPVLMDAWDACDYLGVPRSTFDKWTRQGLIPTVRLGGRARSRLRFRRSDLDAFVSAATTPASAGPLARRSVGEDR